MGIMRDRKTKNKETTTLNILTPPAVGTLTLAGSGDIQTGAKFCKNGGRKTLSEYIRILGGGWHMKNAYLSYSNFVPDKM